MARRRQKAIRFEALLARRDRLTRDALSVEGSGLAQFVLAAARALDVRLAPEQSEGNRLFR